jgi:hypothetical protein
VSGTATSDSQDGLVSIVLDGDMTQAEDDGLEHDGSILVPTEVGVQEGDEVAVTLTGSDVSTVRVTGVVGNGDRQNAAIAAAKTIADAAQAVAEAVNQHFFADDGGIHVTEATQEDWDESHTGANVLINSIGQLFRDGLNNLLTLTTEDGSRALTIWDGLGNAAENIRAVIGETIQLGNRSSGNYMTLDDTGVEIYNEQDGTTYSAKIGPSSVGLLGGTFTMDSSIQGGSASTIYDTVLSHVLGKVSFIRLRAISERGSGTKTSVFTASADKIETIAANGTNEYSTPAGTVIWSSSGWQMAANVTATLSYPISSCPSGIVLHWQAYASNATQDYDHVYTFIPKQHVVVSNGKGVVCQLANGGFGFVGTKYVYVSDGSIRGHSGNQATGTASGITYNCGHWVLTQIIAV